MASNPPNTLHQNIDVMIAEDSPIQAEILRRRLNEHGFTVRVGVDGADALEQIRARKPTILVSDIEMPTLDGYELCSAVKRDPQLQDVPVILLSSLSDPEDIVRGLHAGADNYVTKPYEPAYLISRIHALLESASDNGSNGNGGSLEVTLAGKKYSIQSSRRQALNLLISTFENAVEKNHELTRTNEQLTVAQDQIEQRNSELERLNERLNAANEKMTRDLEAGAKIQQSLLPTALPVIKGFNFAWVFRPCDQLAGDFLNVFELDDKHLGIYVVDVSGHGVAASLLSVTISRMLTPSPFISSLLVKTVVGTDELVISSPTEVLTELNRRFPFNEQNLQYFTICYAILNTQTRQLRYASAGHPPIVHSFIGGEPELLTQDSFPIGFSDEPAYAELSLQLEAGHRIWLYSDGIVEAANQSDELFGDEHLLKSIAENQQQSLEDSVANLTMDVETWTGAAGPEDDVSIIAIEVE